MFSSIFSPMPSTAPHTPLEIDDDDLILPSGEKANESHFGWKRIRMALSRRIVGVKMVVTPHPWNKVQILNNEEFLTSVFIDPQTSNSRATDLMVQEFFNTYNKTYVARPRLLPDQYTQTGYKYYVDIPDELKKWLQWGDIIEATVDCETLEELQINNTKLYRCAPSKANLFDVQTEEDFLCGKIVTIQKINGLTWHEFLYGNYKNTGKSYAKLRQSKDWMANDTWSNRQKFDTNKEFVGQGILYWLNALLGIMIAQGAINVFVGTPSSGKTSVMKNLLYGGILPYNPVVDIEVIFASIGEHEKDSAEQTATLTKKKQEFDSNQINQALIDHGFNPHRITILEANYDRSYQDKAAVMETVVHMAMRKAELGKQVIIICDSLPMMVQAYQKIPISPGMGFGSGGSHPYSETCWRTLISTAKSTRGSGSIAFIFTMLFTKTWAELLQTAFSFSRVVQLTDSNLVQAGVFPSISMGGYIETVIDGQRAPFRVPFSRESEKAAAQKLYGEYRDRDNPEAWPAAAAQAEADAKILQEMRRKFSAAMVPPPPQRSGNRDHDSDSRPNVSVIEALPTQALRQKAVIEIGKTGNLSIAAMWKAYQAANIEPVGTTEAPIKWFDRVMTILHPTLEKGWTSGELKEKYQYQPKRNRAV